MSTTFFTYVFSFIFLFMIPLQIRVTLLSLLCFGLLTSYSQSTKSSIDFYLGPGLSKVIGPFPSDFNYYYEFILPVYSFEGGARLNYKFNDFLSTNTSLGLARIGFEGRHFDGIIADTIYKFRHEYWSRLYFYNAVVSGGVMFNMKKIIAVNANLKVFYQFKGVERRREAFLSDFHAQNFILEPETLDATDYKKINTGLELSLRHWVSASWSVEIAGFLGFNRIQDLETTGNEISYWQKYRYLRLGIHYSNF